MAVEPNPCKAEISPARNSGVALSSRVSRLTIASAAPSIRSLVRVRATAKRTPASPSPNVLSSTPAQTGSFGKAWRASDSAAPIRSSSPASSNMSVTGAVRSSFHWESSKRSAAKRASPEASGSLRTATNASRMPLTRGAITSIAAKRINASSPRKAATNSAGVA